MKSCLAINKALLFYQSLALSKNVNRIDATFNKGQLIRDVFGSFSCKYIPNSSIMFTSIGILLLVYVILLLLNQQILMFKQYFVSVRLFRQKQALFLQSFTLTL